MRYVLMESNSKVSAQYTICISLFMHENRQYKLNALHPGIVFFFEKINKFRGFDKLKHISKKNEEIRFRLCKKLFRNCLQNPIHEP